MLMTCVNTRTEYQISQDEFQFFQFHILTLMDFVDCKRILFCYITSFVMYVPLNHG